MRNARAGGWPEQDRPAHASEWDVLDPSAARPELRNWVLAVWGMYLLAAITFGAVALLGVAVAYIKRGDSRGTIWESHFNSQIRTFWISLLLFLVAFPLALIFIGWIVWGVMLVYYLWKSVKGLVRAVDGDPYR